jgi:hypothetical protein
MARARDTRDVWMKRVERWKDSGLTAKEFALEIGVNHHTLTHWKYQLERKGKGRRSDAAGGQTSPRPSFVEVSSSMLVRGEHIEVVVKGGDVVRVPVGFDGVTLERVLDVLRQQL